MTEPNSCGPIQSWMNDVRGGWDRFWFTRRLPHTLALIRICCGCMLVYIHLIWASLLTDFFGATAWLDHATIRQLHAQDWGWSWLFYIDTPTILWAHQIVAILAAAMMAMGLFTRVTTALAWWMTLMVCHRMTGALFGLDQVVVMLSMYLMFSHCGSVWSLDALRNRSNINANGLTAINHASVSNNICTRLIQLHLCVIYLFGGLSKMRGEMWFDGSALWWTAVNFEYQSLDITWIGRANWLVAALTGITIFWETFYCAIVWPKATRPIALLMAVGVHGGIAVALGMVTFGTIMIVANLAFVSPILIRSIVDRAMRFIRQRSN